MSMFPAFTRRFIHFSFLFIFACEIQTSEVLRPRGVSLSRAPLYAPGKDFVCLDGSLTIPFIQVNDDYCDCPDGSDEPGTSACPHGLFYCTNAGHKPLIIASARVNDGICDCCDASDEYANSNSNCVNNCNELGRNARVEAQKKAELIKIGSQLRAELSQKGILLKQENKEKLLVLNRNKHEAEHLRKEKELLKVAAEELEAVALKQYAQVEEPRPEEPKEEIGAQEAEGDDTKTEARATFDRFDSNQDGKLDLSELQTRPAFDRNRDGQITEEEAKYFLDENTEMDFETFLSTSWPKIKPFLMLESGLFKPPSETTDPTTGGDEEEDLDEEDPADRPEETAGEEEDMDEEDYDSEMDREEEQDRKDDLVTKPQYDEETQKLIDEANQARSQLSEAERALRDIQTEIKNIEESLEKDYGPDEEFASLDGQCFEYSDREYIYKLCPFDQVTQRPKSGGGDTRLGTWGSWVGAESNKYETMLYDRGQSCWNGPQRTTHVRVACGSDHVLQGVSEPNRCEYVMDFSTPAACNPALIDRSAEDTHDEL